MTDVWMVLILLVLVGAIVAYLHRAKKRGITCIGCPHAGKCGGSCKKQ